MVYRIVEFAKPRKHVKGAENQVIQAIQPYKLLIQAEKDFYKLCRATVGDGVKNSYFSLDDMRYNNHLEFYDCATGIVRVKTHQRNKVGKYSFMPYTLEEYKHYLVKKAQNKLTQVI